MPEPTPNELENDRRASLAMQWSLSQHLVEAFIRSMVPNADDRDDLLQETAKQAALNFDRYDPERPFANWAVGIARYKVLELRRRSNRSAKVLGSDALDQVAEAFYRVQDESADRSEAMEICLGRLKPRHRKLLSMRYTDDLEVKLIAEQLGSRPNTISVSLYKIRQALAECIERRLRQDERGRDAH